QTDYDEVLSQLGNDSLELLHGEAEIDLKELERATEEAPVVRLVNALLTDAIRKRASDVHVEPYEKMLRVRFRIDGVLYEIMQPPLRLKNALTSRIKVMAQLDIAERRLPQDGRIKMKLAGNKEMDFRVSVLPTMFGEKVGRTETRKSISLLPASFILMRPSWGRRRSAMSSCAITLMREVSAFFSLSGGCMIS